MADKARRHTKRASQHAALAKYWGGDGTGMGTGPTMKAAARKAALGHSKLSARHQVAAARARGEKKK